VDSAAYRLLQESLNNARRHAPGSRVVVCIDRGQSLRLEVRNEIGHNSPPSEGEQYGLVGMRERVQLLGGELEARQVGHEFVVEARLPVVATA
jgi:signal transduction histidine kinase